MNRQDAQATTDNLTATGVFSKTDWDEAGFNTGDFIVNAWIKNSRTGNNTLSRFTALVTPAEAKKAAKAAKKEQAEKDSRTMGNRRADRQNQC